MVFEGLVSDVLSKVLGEYVKNLNKDQLKIGIFGGNVSLTNLELKEDALANLPINLPVQVKKGFLGRLDLKVPWKDLKSKPVIIHIDQIFALAVPQSQNYKYDEAEEAKKAVVQKRKRLENYEWIKSLKEAEEVDDGTGGSSSGGDKDKSNFTSRLVTKIIDNLQIVINKVHIRFENRNELGRLYSIGITLDKISAQSCDERWIPSFIDSNKTQVIHKLAEMHSLGMYIDDSSESFQNLSTSEFQSKFLEIIPDQNTTNLLLKSFIIKPISSQLKVKINKNEIIDKQIPKIISDCIFSQITVSLSSVQYRTILHVLQFTNEFLRDIKYLKFRPQVDVHSNPRSWWKYAIQVHLDQIRQKRFRRSWAFLLERRKDRIFYIQLFKRSLPKITWLTPLGKQEQQQLTALEDKLAFEDIIYFRSLAYAEIKKETEKNKLRKDFLDSKKSERGFFTNLFSTAKKKEDEISAPIVQLSNEERDELYKTIEYSDVVQMVEEPPDWVKIVANLDVKGFNVQLIEYDNVFMDAAYTGLSLRLEQRNEGVKVIAGIKLFEVYDQFTKKTQFPKIISSIQTKGTGTFANAIIDTCPKDKNMDLFIELNMDPLNVVVTKPLIFKIVDFFHDPNLDITNISNRAGNHIVNFTERAKVQLQEAIDNHKTMGLFVNIHAPVIVIPESVVLSDSTMKSNALVVDLGNFKIKSDLTDANIKGKIVGSTANENDFYDKFNVSLESVHVLLTDDLTMVWNDSKMKKDSHIIKKFDINLNIFSCIQQDNLTLTKLKVQGELNQFDVHLSDRKIKQLLAIADSATKDIAAHTKSKQQSLSASQQNILSNSTGSTNNNNTGGSSSNGGTIDAITSAVSSSVQMGLGNENQDLQKKLLIEHRQLSAVFVIKSINVHLSNSHSQLITLSLNDLSVNFIQRTYDSSGTFNMGSLEIHDSFTKNSLKKLATSNPEQVLSTYMLSPQQQQRQQRSSTENINKNNNNESSMVHVDFKQINPESPEYEKQDMSANVKIQNFYFVINPSTIYQLLVLLKTLEPPKPVNVPSEESKVLISSSTTTRVQTDSDGVQRPRKVLRTLRYQVAKPKKKQPSEFIVFKFNLEIQSLGLAMNQDNDTLLGIFSINGFKTEVINYKDTRLVVKGALNNILLEDFTEAASRSKYKHVIKPTNDTQSMVEFQFKTHPNNLADYLGHDTSVQANVKSILIHTNVPFLLKLQDYFLGGTFEPVMNPFFKVPGSEDIQPSSSSPSSVTSPPQQGTFSPVSQSSANNSPILNSQPSSGATSPVLTAGTNHGNPIQRMKLNIDVETPIIIIPQAMHTDNKIKVELGRVVISNTFSDHTKAKLPMDNMKVQLENTNITIEHSEYGQSHFLEKLSLDINLHRTLQQPNIHPDIEDLHMSLIIPKLSFKLDEKQYKFFLSMADSLTAQMEDTKHQINEIKTIRALPIDNNNNNNNNINQSPDQQQKINEYDMQYFTKDEVIASLGKTVSRIIVQMDLFSFSIINQEGEIAHFTIKDTNVELCNTSSEKTKLQLLMKSILLTDTRKSSLNIYKSIIKNSTEKGFPFINLGYIRDNVLGDQYINADINNPNVFLSPTPLFLISEFFTKPLIQQKSSLVESDIEDSDDEFDLNIDDIELQLNDQPIQKPTTTTATSKSTKKPPVPPPKRKETVVKPAVQTPPVSPTSLIYKQARVPSITLHARVNPTVTLVENETKVTRCLIFKTKLDLKFKRDPRGIENAEFLIQNTKINIYRPIQNHSGLTGSGSNISTLSTLDFQQIYESEQGSRPIQILKPIEKIKVIYNKQNLISYNEWKQDIEVISSPFKLFFSYDDLTTMSNIVNHILEQQKQLSPSLSPNSTTVTSTSDGGSTLSDLTNSTSSMSQLPGMKEDDSLYSQNEKLRFSCPTFSILFINESPELYLPLAELYLTDIEANVVNWSKDIHIKTLATLKSDYFNEINMKFEPLIEDWEFRTDLKKSNSGKLRGSFVATKDILNVNVTYGLLQTVSSTIKLIEAKERHKDHKHKKDHHKSIFITPSILSKHLNIDDDEETTTSTLTSSIGSNSSSTSMSSKGSNKHFHSHWLSNDTGIDFEYSIPRHETPFYNFESSSNIIPVPVKLSKNRDSTIGDHMKLTLRNSNYYIDDISLDYVGFSIYQFKNNNNNSSSSNNNNLNELLVDIKLRPDGSKLISFKSLYHFENNSNLEFDLKIENSIIKIQKYGKFSLPLLQSNSFKQFSFKLVDSNQWSDLVDVKMLMDLNNDNSKIYKLVDTSSQQKPYFISMLCEKKVYNTSTNKTFQTIKFNPPIKLENLLPQPFTINFPNCEKIDMSVGDTLDIYHYQPDSTLTVVISNLDGFPETKNNILSGDWNSPSVAKHFKLESHPRVLILDIEHSQVIHGIHLISIYCQYWLVNNSLLPIQVKLGDHDSLPLPINEPEKESNSPTLFSATSMKIKVSTYAKDEPLKPGEKKKKRYSQKFPIVTVGNACSILVPNPDSDVPGSAFEIAYKVDFCKNSKFGLSKVITFTPRHVIYNSLPYPIVICQYIDNKEKEKCNLKDNSLGEMLLQPGEYRPHHWVALKSETKKISILPKPPNQENEYNHSGGFFIDSVTDLVIKCRSKTGKSNHLLYHVNIQDMNGILYVTIPPINNEAPPYLIENDTPMDIIIHQQAQDKNIDSIPAQTKLPYGWDDPSGEYILFATVNGVPLKKRISINKIKGYSHMVDNKYNIYITISIENGSRLIQFSSSDRKYKKMKKYEENSLIMSQDSSEYHLYIRLAGIGISIIDQNPMEIAYVSMKELFLQVTQSKAENTVELKLGDFQIDNQLIKTDYPVILSNIKNEKTSKKDFLHISLVKSTINNIDYFRYFSMLIQEMDIQFEDHWLKVLMDFAYSLPEFSNKSSKSENSSSGKLEFHKKDLFENVSIKPPSQESSSIKMLYFVLLVLNPIKVNLTLALQNDGLFQTNHKILSSIEGLGFSLTKLDRAPITLNGLIMEHPFSSRAILIEKIKSSYISQTLSQFYKILGSIDAIGNPAGLFRNFGTGVHDFFVEPAQGIVKSPGEFGKGLAKGTSSLVKNSIYGTFNSISKITSTIGTGVANLSFDDQYLNERKIQQARKPKHIGEGLAMGGVGLGRGILQGLTGIVTKPVEGAKKGGVLGFAKGIAQGVVGIAVKPATAVIDLTTKATEGIKNTTNLQLDIDRVRPPRCFIDGLLYPFDFKESEGWFLLKTSHKGKHAHEKYIWHHIINPDQTVIITDQSLILVKNKKNLLHSTFIYRISFSVIKQVTLVENKGIVLEFDPPQTLSLLDRDQKRTTIAVTVQNINELLYLKLSHTVDTFKKQNIKK